MLTRPALLFVVGFASLLGGCSDSSSADENSLGVNSLVNQVQQIPELAVATSGIDEPFNDLSPIEIHGLWDFSQDYSDGLLNVRYIEVTEAGTWRVWDYQGDTYDQGDNCFFSNDSTFKRTGGSEYRLTDGEAVLDISATVAPGGLILKFDNGRSLRLPKVDTLSPVDFNRCDQVG
ncbi:MAG: hypothetical protein V3U76_01930 [Granulosicoccus sp.]